MKRLAIGLGALVLSAGLAQAQPRFDNKQCEPLPLTIRGDEQSPVGLDRHQKKETRICAGESRYEIFVTNKTDRTITEFELLYEFTAQTPAESFRMVFNADPFSEPLRLPPTAAPESGLHYRVMRETPQGVQAAEVHVTRVRFDDGSTWMPGSTLEPKAEARPGATGGEKRNETELEFAARSGEAEAQYQLGLRFAEGQGALQDFIMAHAWLNLAAAQGHAAAQLRRDAVADQMTPKQIAAAQKLARKWQREAAD